MGLSRFLNIVSINTKQQSKRSFRPLSSCRVLTDPTGLTQIKVQPPLGFLLYTIFDRKGTPLISYPLIDEWCPFHIPKLEHSIPK